MGRVGSGGVILRGGLNSFKVKCGACLSLSLHIALHRSLTG